MLREHVQPGDHREEMRFDDLAMTSSSPAALIPAPLNYRGFPRSSRSALRSTTSVCHGIPGPKRLRDGDIVNIDVTVIVDGWHGDTSGMLPSGASRAAPSGSSAVTYEALQRGIAAVEPGACPPPGISAPPSSPMPKPSAAASCARSLRHTGSPGLPRPPQHPALRRDRRRRAFEARHAVHHRADDQPRAPRT